MAIAISPFWPWAQNLTGEQCFEAVVIGDAGDGGDIGGEGNGRERSALPFIAADELGCDVSRIRGAAAVAEQQHFVSFAKSRGHECRDLHDPIGMFARELLLDGRAVGKRAQHDVLS